LVTWPGFVQVLLTVLAAALVLYALKRDRLRLLRLLSRPPLLPLATYYVYGLLAAAFSHYRLLALASAGHALIALGLTVVVFGATDDEDPHRGLGYLYVACAIACAAALLAWALRPELVWTPYERGEMRLGGIGLHPNQLGFLAAILGIGGFRAWLDTPRNRDRVLPTLALALALPVLVAARGRTDVVGFLAGVAITLLLTGRWIWVAVIPLAGVIPWVFLPGFDVHIVAFFTRGTQLSTLRGRLVLWQYLIGRTASSLKGWLLGEGVGTSAQVLRGQVASWPSPGHSHNLLVEAFHSLGLPGVLLMLAALVGTALGLVACLSRARHHSRSAPVDLAAAFVLLLGVSMLEHSMAGRANVYAFAGWAIAATTALHAEKRDPDG
jgi:O-antigen ligase